MPRIRTDYFNLLKAKYPSEHTLFGLQHPCDARAVMLQHLPPR